MALGLKVQRAYPSDKDVFHWRGTSVEDETEFDVFLRGPVKARVTDAAFEKVLANDLQALATSDMATATLQTLLESSVCPLDWEIGEAMAECLLEDEFGVVWPWNENRDRKTPRASLPGADLVGLWGDGEDTKFLFGEVKTSSDANCPPGVMAGRGGLAHQIDTLAIASEIHLSLVRWLAARCKGTPLWPRYQAACKRYLNSGGKDVALVGILLRDTKPHQDDLRTRATYFAGIAAPKPDVRLHAWYAPRSISDWVNITMATP